MVRQELQDIKKSNNYSTALNARKKTFEKENTLTAFFLTRFDKDYKNPKKNSLKWWEREFEKLKKQATKADSQTLKMYERVRFQLFVSAYSMSRRNKASRSEAQQLFCESLISLLRSQQQK